MNSTTATRPRAAAATKSPRRAYRGDSNAFTVAVLSIAATGIALYDLCLLAISLH